MGAWRVARSLATLRDQVNAAHPDRSKAADGTIGDAAHAATKSEHNPDSSGVVRALDLTHDPRHGLDAGELARQLIASRDPRILYVISNGRIASSVVAPWTWRRYTGADPHTGHVHISVVERPSLYDSTAHWSITQEEDMELTDAQLDQIASRTADKVWAEVLPVLDNEKGSTAKAQLTRANVYGYRNNKLLAALTSTGYAKQIAATIVAMLPAGAEVDTDELARKIVVELVREVETEEPA